MKRPLLRAVSRTIGEMPMEPTSEQVIEQAKSLRERFSLLLRESQKTVERSREALARLDDIYRQLNADRHH